MGEVFQIWDNTTCQEKANCGLEDLHSPLVFYPDLTDEHTLVATNQFVVYCSRYVWSHFLWIVRNVLIQHCTQSVLSSLLLLIHCYFHSFNCFQGPWRKNFEVQNQFQNSSDQLRDDVVIHSLTLILLLRNTKCSTFQRTSLESCKKIWSWCMVHRESSYPKRSKLTGGFTHPRG